MTRMVVSLVGTLVDIINNHKELIPYLDDEKRIV